MHSLFLQAATLRLMFVEDASPLLIGQRSGVMLTDTDRQAEVASLRITLEGALEGGEFVLVNATPVGGEVVSGSVVSLDQRASLQHYQVSRKSSLVSRPHFSRPPEKWVWSTAYSIFVQVRRNVGALFFSNLTFDVINNCIPHCVRTIY